MEIGIILFDDMTMLDAMGPYEVLWRVPGAHVVLIGAEVRPFSTNGGAQLLAQADFDSAPALDVLVVPGGPGTRQLMESERTLELVRDHAASARWVASVCSGSLVLASAGVLAGRRASTHWNSEAQLRSMGVEVSERRVTIDGRIVTSAGVSAGIDLGLVLAEQLSDRESATAIQWSMEYRPEPPFDIGERRSPPVDVRRRAAELRQSWFGGR